MKSYFHKHGKHHHEHHHDSCDQQSHRVLERALKAVLKRHHGSTKHKDVRKAIDELTPHNPTEEPTKSPLFVGDFICHTLPEFPGRIKPKDKSNTDVQYTLGKLSFGMFQPNHLVCTVRSVRQSIRVRCETKSGTFKTYAYPVMMDLTIHAVDPQDGTEVLLPCMVNHDAVCYECPKQPHRMKVIFKGSTLMPSPAVLSHPDLLHVWMTTFEGAYQRAALERNILNKALRGFMTWWFQITHHPTDDEMAANDDRRVHFEMKRCPKGYLDILYMSDTTRITRGNRGTLVVVEPTTTTTTTYLDDIPKAVDGGSVSDLVLEDDSEDSGGGSSESQERQCQLDHGDDEEEAGGSFVEMDM